MMSREAIESVTNAENEAKERKAKALKKAADDISEAERDAENAVKAGVARAEDELKHMMNAAVKKAEEDAHGLAEKTSGEQLQIRSRAAKRLDDAARLIIERIVND
ncbi:MAG: hypothetical protein HUJ65_03030 [Oscillospiraceae bacterium]|nr:hypothetical protein [Oscillospiraceae bacterium]